MASRSPAAAAAAPVAPPARAGIDDAISDVPATQRKPEAGSDDVVPAAQVGQSVIVPIPGDVELSGRSAPA